MAAAATCVPSAFGGIKLSTSSRNPTCSVPCAHYPVFTCFASKKNSNKLSFMDQICWVVSTQVPHHENKEELSGLILLYLHDVGLGLTPPNKILDYIEGGPKLRKWYGAPDILPKDASNLEDEDSAPEEGEVRDAVLVTDGDNEIGQMVILSLIIKRSRVKALVKDKRAAIESFGTYVESMAGDANDERFLKKALRGVRAIICPNEGFISSVESLKGVQHVILLSQLSAYEGSSGLQAIMNGNAKKLAEQDESVIRNSGIPYTIIRTGSLTNTPGGKQGFSFKEGSAAQGTLSKEDAAFICVEALDTVPKQGLTFEVVNGEEKVMNWKDCFTKLVEKAEE